MVKRFGTELIDAANGAIILDVGSGSGRNAIHLAAMGGNVLCVDRNFQALRFLPRSERLAAVTVELSVEAYPFVNRQFGGIVCVDFPKIGICEIFANLLIPRGRLLIQTIPAHGGNYLDLPRAGELRANLLPSFEIEFLSERPAGPSRDGKVTVSLLARRRT